MALTLAMWSWCRDQAGPHAHCKSPRRADGRHRGPRRCCWHRAGSGSTRRSRSGRGLTVFVHPEAVLTYATPPGASTRSDLVRPCTGRVFHDQQVHKVVDIGQPPAGPAIDRDLAVEPQRSQAAPRRFDLGGVASSPWTREVAVACSNAVSLPSPQPRWTISPPRTPVSSRILRASASCSDARTRGITSGSRAPRTPEEKPSRKHCQRRSLPTCQT